MLTRASSTHPHIPTTAGNNTPLNGELKCYKCGQKSHIKPQCHKLKGKQRIARAQVEDVVDEDNPTDGPFGEASNNAQEEVDSLLKEEEDLNRYSDGDDDDEPKHTWDDQEYKANFIHFINEEPIIDTQMCVPFWEIY